MSGKIILLDGNSIINRAFYGIPVLTNSEGTYTNAVYGFLNIFFKLIDDEKPDYAAVAFDLPQPTFRHKKYAEYKGTRKGMPDELRPQLPLLKEALAAMDVYTCEKTGYEADDILGTLARRAEENGITPVIISGDRDMLQIATDTVKIRIPKTKAGKTETEDYYAKDVLEKYGVTPKEFIDLKALMGDTSDNIPGVPGIGEKTAAKIIKEFKSVENAVENSDKITPSRAAASIKENIDKAVLSKYLATIDCAVPLEFSLERMKLGAFATDEAYTLFKRLEFKSLLSRFEKKPDKIDLPCKKLVTRFELNELSEKLESAGESSYVLLCEDGELSAIAIYTIEHGGFFIEPSDTLSADKAFETLKDYFENPAYKKITNNAKKDIQFLKKYKISLNGVIFDTSIAGYILNPTRDTYEFDDLAKEYLGEILSSSAETLGKGKTKKHLSSISEEARASYTVKQAEVIYRAKTVMDVKLAENGQEKLYYEIELPLLYVLADMEQFGIKIDKSALLKFQSKLSKSIDKVTEEIYALAGEEFLINSPKQLGVILFEKLGLKGGKKTKTGYSTAADILEKLRPESEIVDKILTYRQLVKLKSTYADGLLNVMDEKTQRVYSTFNQTITATGRISSTEPNLQNIPVRLELGREIRKVFIPENDNYIFIDADYSQIELRVLAHISGDETLISAFKNGQDIHRLTASQVLNIPFDEVTPAERNSAKAVNFGIVYGIGAFSLSQDLGITVKEADRYISQYFKKYPKIKSYMDKTIENAKENGYVSTIYGRRRSMPELFSQNFNERSFGERVAKNMPIQGSAADIIKIAMVRVSQNLKKGGFKSRLILQVHDELLIEAAKDEANQVADMLKYEMENAVKLDVPLTVDVNTGSSWYETK